MPSIFDLNKGSAPFTYLARETIPFRDFIFDYSVQKQGAFKTTKSAVVHIVRSSITLGSYGVFILAGLVEKAVRSTLKMIKAGIDKVLTKHQQDNIKNKTIKLASNSKAMVLNFYYKHFAPLFRR